MAPFDFDHAPDRRGSDSVKYARYAGRDIIPMWVADMDWPAPPAVVAALRRRVDEGVYGYTLPSEGLLAATTEMLARNYDWQVEPGWIVWLPGLVPALHLACRAFAANAGVTIPTPMYYPFFGAVRDSGCELHRAPLTNNDQCWELDIAALDTAAGQSRLLLFCNPHNPVGRAYTRAELERVADLAASHELTVVSDEIHCQLVLDSDRRHIPLATLGDDIAARTVTLMAPSKTYNLPGLNCGFAIIPDDGRRRRFEHERHGIVPWNNALGYAACEAAYRDGEPWRREVVGYLRGNRDRVAERIAAMPGLAVNHVEATYLAWIDARELPTDDPQGFFEDAGVGLSDGRPFGGNGFVRLNFACPRSTLDRALDRMAGKLT